MYKNKEEAVNHKRARRDHYARRRNQDLLDTDVTLLQDGERVPFAEGLQIHRI